MDRTLAYTGEHAPVVKLDGAERRGLRQSGLALRKGTAYTGRIVLAGDPEAKVAVTLEGQTVAIPRLTAAYKTFPLKFQAQAGRDSARFEIAGTGSGAFRVGAVSLMPADNVQGFRAEVIAALKSLRSGVYRFPGGNFVSAHEWRDAIGDRDKRPPVMDPVWNAVQPNDVGTDEFLALCRLLEVEPYITVNAGFGDAWSAAQLVEYVNGPASTPMGRLRAANGHPEPYRVRLWGIGNEMFGDWQFGFMEQKQYQFKHTLFARAMRRADPSITLLASGAMPDHLTGSKWVKQLTGRNYPEYLGPGDWTGGLLANCLDYLDMLSEHYYAYSNRRFDLEKGERVTLTGQPLVEWARQPANYVRVKYEHYQEYLERIPALRKKRVPVSISEWAYTGANPHSHRVVLAYAWVFHEMFRHSELIRMANFTFATSLIRPSRTEAVLNPAGLMFKLYRDRFGAVPVEVSGSSPQPAPLYPAGGNQPKVNPGSPTYPLDVAAALTADRKALTVAVLNPTEDAQQLTIKGAPGPARLWRMAPETLDATSVEVQEQSLDLAGPLAIPPFSVSIYRVEAGR
jgi:alpha-N-arabinofuranosidase